MYEYCINFSNTKHDKIHLVLPLSRLYSCIKCTHTRVENDSFSFFMLLHFSWHLNIFSVDDIFVSRNCFCSLIYGIYYFRWELLMLLSLFLPMRSHCCNIKDTLRNKTHGIEVLSKLIERKMAQIVWDFWIFFCAIFSLDWKFYIIFRFQGFLNLLKTESF